MDHGFFSDDVGKILLDFLYPVQEIDRSIFTQLQYKKEILSVCRFCEPQSSVINLSLLVFERGKEFGQ
jgi:hypothetical protein